MYGADGPGPTPHLSNFGRSNAKLSPPTTQNHTEGAPGSFLEPGSWVSSWWVAQSQIGCRTLWVFKGAGFDLASFPSEYAVTPSSSSCSRLTIHYSLSFPVSPNSQIPAKPFHPLHFRSVIEDSLQLPLRLLVFRVRVLTFPPLGLSKFFRPFPGGVKDRENPHFFLLYPVSDEERRP